MAAFVSKGGIIRCEMVNISAEFVENCDSLYCVCGATTHRTDYVLNISMTN